MQFLRTIFWVALAVLGVAFALNNWTEVSIHLWGEFNTVWKLPFLLLVVFLLGLLPPLILHRITRWSLRRKLDAANRSLTETRGVAETPQVRYQPVAPGSAPIAPPPGVA